MKNFLAKGGKVVLGFQHLIAMFGATTLVPLLTGLDPAVTLVSAGIGTLIFHFCTNKKVPVFLGSSFAFIPGILAVGASHGLAYAQGGIIVAGALYLLLAALIYKVGFEAVDRYLPKYIIGTMIVIIGTSLIPTALSMASNDWQIAITTFAVALLIMFSNHKFLKQTAIISAIGVGYTISFMLGLVDLSPIAQAAWIAMPNFTAPKFDIGAIMIIAPLVLATFMEHIGDITANGTVVGKNFIKDPGLHRTLIGDGLATIFAGLIGGPANTTYGENTGVLAITKNYNPQILRIAAVFAIVLGVVGKTSAILGTIPIFVLGGVSVLLFGMIAKIGATTLYKVRSQITVPQTIIIVVMLVLAFGKFSIGVFSGMSLAAIVSIAINALLLHTQKKV